MDKITMALCCRACLQLEELMVHIYGEVVGDVQSDLSTLLEQCGGIKVKKEDGYPQFLCKECTSELLMAAKFREKCEQTQQILTMTQWSEEALPLAVETDEQQPQDTAADIMEDSSLQDNTLLLANASEEQTELEAALSSLPLEFDAVESVQSPAVDPQNEEVVYSNINTTAQSEVDENALVLIDSLDMPVEEIHKEIIIEDNAADDVQYTQLSHPQWQILSQLQTADEKIQFVCDTCGASFMQPANLRRHMEKVHMAVELYSCDKCGYCYSTAEHYKSHCESCQISGTTSSKENRIGETVERNLKQHKCCHCGKRMQSAFALNMHLRTHTGERPFGCEYCSKAFKSQSALSIHLKRHAGIPDFACTVCDKTFYESSNLTAHMRTHTGERPHECSICKKRFSRVFLLQLHMRTHTGEKPYQCNQCDRAFAQRCDLRNHMRSHTGERHFKCPICAKTFVRRYPLVVHMEKHAALSPNSELKGEEVESSDVRDNSEELVDANICDRLTEYTTIDNTANAVYNIVEEPATATILNTEQDFNWHDLIVQEEVL